MSAIQPAWHDPDSRRILKFEFFDDWTWQDYELSHQVGYRMMSEVQHPVVIIHAPTSEVAMKIAKGNGIAVIRSLLSRTPANLVGIYVVNSTTFARVFGNIFSTMITTMGSEIHFVQTLESALELAEKRLTAAGEKQQA